jgi:hypothetical protein
MSAVLEVTTAPRARGVLFRPDMAEAIAAGRKTVTRRVGATWSEVKAGDRLWGREQWRAPAICDALSPTAIGERALDAGYSRPAAPIWWSDGTFNRWCAEDHAHATEWGGPGRLRPAIHMPRWASRLELEVVSIRVEHPPMALLVDEAEAHREGFETAEAFLAAWVHLHPESPDPVFRVEFRRLS